MKFFLIAITFILFKGDLVAQNTDSNHLVPKYILDKINSLHPNLTHLRCYSNKDMYEVSFEADDYFFKSLNSSFTNYRDWRIDSIKIGKNMFAKFDSLYSNASSISWYNKDSLFDVSFQCNCKEGYDNIEFDKKGNIIKRNRMVNLDETPKEITTYLQKHYSQYLLPCFLNEEIDGRGNVKYYARVDIKYRFCSDCEFYWVFFDKDGVFISEKHVPGGL